jgi:hypothetical protein
MIIAEIREEARTLKTGEYFEVESKLTARKMLNQLGYL